MDIRDVIYEKYREFAIKFMGRRPNRVIVGTINYMDIRALAHPVSTISTSPIDGSMWMFGMKVVHNPDAGEKIEVAYTLEK